MASSICGFSLSSTIRSAFSFWSFPRVAGAREKGEEGRNNDDRGRGEVNGRMERGRGTSGTHVIWRIRVGGDRFRSP